MLFAWNLLQWKSTYLSKRSLSIAHRIVCHDSRATNGWVWAKMLPVRVISSLLIARVAFNGEDMITGSRSSDRTMTLQMRKRWPIRLRIATSRPVHCTLWITLTFWHLSALSQKYVYDQQRTVVDVKINASLWIIHKHTLLYSRAEWIVCV